MNTVLFPDPNWVMVKGIKLASVATSLRSRLSCAMKKFRISDDVSRDLYLPVITLVYFLLLS